jgi:oligopeptide transport system substrate-binding protein
MRRSALALRFAAFAALTAIVLLLAPYALGVEPERLPLLATAALGAVALAFAAQVLIARPLNDRLRRGREVMARLAGGDLYLGPKAQDADLVRLVTSLRRALREVQHVAQNVQLVGGEVVAECKELLSAARRQMTAVDHALDAAQASGENLAKGRLRVDSVEAFAHDASESLTQMTERMTSVSRALESLDQAALTNREAVSQMTAGLESIASETVELASLAGETDLFVTDVVERIASVRTRASETGDLARAVARTAEAGETLVAQFVEGVRTVDDSVRRATEIVQSLGKSSEEIGRIVDVIQEVADQTKLLSLNAAIIAAQAGEYGQPFSVVAGEIRGLAERTAGSTREIAALIARVRGDVEGAVAVVSEGHARARAGLAHGDVMARALGAIRETAHRASAAVDLTLSESSTLSEQGKQVSEASRVVAERVAQVGQAAAAQARSGKGVGEKTVEMSRRASDARAETQGQAQMARHLTEAVSRVSAAVQDLRASNAALARGDNDITAAILQVREDASRVTTVADGMFRTAGELSRGVEGLEGEAFRFRIPPPRRGGLLRVGLSCPQLLEATRRLDPLYVTDLQFAEPVFPFYSTLVRAGAGTHVAPDLAESWDVDVGGRRYRFRLRSGVRFHDGAPFNAGEVKRCFERFLAPGEAAPAASIFRDVEGAAAYADGQASDVKGMVAVSDLELDIQLREPRAFFLNQLCLPVTAISRRTASGVPQGTGPFRLASMDGERLLLERYDAYHGPHLTFVDRVEVRYTYADGVSVVRACRDGEVDLAPVVRRDEFDRVPEVDALNLVGGHSLSIFFVGFNCKAAPFSDVRVRRAVRAALNVRDAVVRFHAGAELARSVLPPELLGVDLGLSIDADPAAARDLLHQAGFPNGIDVAITVPSPKRDDENECLFSLFGEAGLRLRVEELPAGVFWQRVRTGELKFFRAGWAGDYPDPDAFLSYLGHSRIQGLVNFGYENAEYDRLCDEARISLDPEVRRALYERAIRILHDDVPFVPLFHERAFAVCRPGIEGVRVNLTSPRVRLEDTWLSDE